MSHPPAIGLIACEVFSAEIALAAAGATHTEVLELNLQPDFEDCYINHLFLP